MKQSRRVTWPYSAAHQSLAQLHLAGPAGPAHLLPLVLFLLCQEDEQRRGVARAREASATSCFPLATSCFLSSPWTPSATPRTLPGLSLSPRAPLLLWLSRAQPPNTPVAADEHHRGHRPPRASPMSSEEPPSPSASSTPTHSTAGAL